MRGYERHGQRAPVVLPVKPERPYDCAKNKQFDQSQDRDRLELPFKGLLDYKRQC